MTTVTVMLAVDGSDHSDKAFAWYLDVLHKPCNKVVLCHVQEPMMHPSFGFRAGMAVSEGEWQKMLEEQAKKEEQLTSKYTTQLKEKKIEFEIRKKHGDAGHRLCQAAEECAAHFIVTGSRGLGTLRRTILGSVSDYILHHAHCPVLIYRQ